MSHFEAFEDLSEKWRWRLIGANGRVMATSGESFSSHTGALRAAAGVRRVAAASKIRSAPGRSWKATIRRLIQSEEARRGKRTVKRTRRQRPETVSRQAPRVRSISRH